MLRPLVVSVLLLVASSVSAGETDEALRQILRRLDQIETRLTILESGRRESIPPFAPPARPVCSPRPVVCQPVIIYNPPVYYYWIR